MKIETTDYLTVHNFADRYKGKKGRVTTQYIYKLIREGKIAAIDIDGARFIHKKELK